MHKFSLLMSSFLLMLSAGSAQADVIGLKTQKAVGSELVLALNADVQAQLAWSNGETETVTFDGGFTTVTVKADSLQITSETPLTRFYAADAGLVSLNTTKATKLKKLICPGNALVTLDLSKNTALTELDCQANLLEDLNLKGCRALQDINCAQNKLEKLNYASGGQLTTLICADNQLKSLDYLTGFTKVTSLWCQGNEMEKLNLTASKKIQHLNAANNKLTEASFGEMKQLKTVWLANNQLDSIDFSAGTPILAVMSVENNKLEQIKWDKACKNTLTHFYGQNNHLMFNSLPTISDGMTAVYQPQKPQLYTDLWWVPINEEQDFTNLVMKNAFGILTMATPTITTTDGENLEAGKGKDYYRSGSKITFYTLKKNIVVSFTSKQYNCTLSFAPFHTYDRENPVGIGNTTVSDDSLNVGISAGHLTVSTDKACNIKVYDTAGRCIISKAITAGTHILPLSAGTYIVNGQKVLIP